MPALTLAFQLFLAIIPLTMIAIFIFGLIIASRARERNAKVAAWAGFLAGFVCFVLYAISQKQTPQAALSSLSQLPTFAMSNLVTTVLCTIIVAALLRLLSAFSVLARYIGFITLILSGASLSALDSYFFVASFREPAIYLTLGFILGILLFIVVWPDEGRKLWGEAGWPKS